MTATASEETWPPPKRPTDQHVRRPVIVGPGWRAQVVSLRVVRLWGREVAVAEDGRVHCSGCSAMVDVAGLAAPDNSHRVGLPFRASGRLQPIRDFDDGGDADPAEPGF